jgi:polyphosphate kinase 2 (PPK2 family)
VADLCEAIFQIEETVSETPGVTRCRIEFAATAPLHYASNRYALLLIFQGMDSAGHPPRHVRNQSARRRSFQFRTASAEELEHDFLWRTTRHLPERGRIGVFNRSYYEEVLVVRVRIVRFPSC